MDSDDENCVETRIKIEHLNEFYSPHIPEYLYVSGIHKAVLEGDLTETKRWIESGGCVNETTTDFDFSALHLAVLKNDMEILEYLLTRDGIQIDCPCSQDRTPLQLATFFGYIRLVEKLIQAGSDINLMPNDNSSALHISVRHPDICHLLIRHGALIDTINANDCTPLDCAMMRSSLETIHMLLYYNADVNALGRYIAPFAKALRFSTVDAQRALLEYIDDFDKIGDEYTWLGSTLAFALVSNSPLVKDMIERGADVNYGDDPEVYNETTAFFICLYRRVDLSTFKMVWERLRYNDSKNTIDFLNFLNYDAKVLTFLQVIIESDNFGTAVECFRKGETYYLFVNKFAEKKFDLDLLTALTCRLLEYGFRASSYDIHAIFSNYGYCELFRILLYMDNDFIRGWLPRMALTRLIFDIHFDLKRVVDKVNDIPKRNILQLLQHSVCPRLIDALTLQYREDKNMSIVLSSLPKVPSLKDLARNAARKRIWQSFKITNTCQFYTTIDHLTIPAVYKDFLTFKKSIYVR